MNAYAPIIDQFAAGYLMDRTRYELSRDICSYLENGKYPEQNFYEPMYHLLDHPDTRRILLYLPFKELANPNAPIRFEAAYKTAWYELLKVYDARANFYDGDIFEVDARPGGEPERVVKAAHLTPWLLEYKYLTPNELIDILEQARDDEILLRSFKETWHYLEDRYIVQKKYLSEFRRLTAHIPERVKPEPLYVSQSRIDWLESRDKIDPPIIGRPYLDGPYSLHITAIADKLQTVSDRLHANEVVLVGGSLLKGYGGVNSDLDVYKLEELVKDPRFAPGTPEGIHLYFDCLWLGGSGIDDMRAVSRRYAEYYRRAPEGADKALWRRQCLERLECDLIQYRLLHKGWDRFYGASSHVLKDYPEMDGDCPFYNDGFRRLATKIFAKYVYLP